MSHGPPEIIDAPRNPSWWDPILQAWRADDHHGPWESRRLFAPGWSNVHTATWDSRSVRSYRQRYGDDARLVELGQDVLDDEHAENDRTWGPGYASRKVTFRIRFLHAGHVQPPEPEPGQMSLDLEVAS